MVGMRAARLKGSSRVTRRSYLGQAMVGGAALLAACGTSGPAASGGTNNGGGGSTSSAPAAAKAPVQMEFLHFFTGSIEEGFKTINERFEAKHPHITWQGILTPYGEMHTKIVALVAAGTPPDGMAVASTRAQELIMRKVLRELDPYLSKDKSVPLADVYPARVEDYKRTGKIYALPVDNGTGAIFYNKELFDKAGVPYPTNDWTWDDLQDKARRLTRKDDPSGPVYGFQYPTSLHNFFSPFAGQGGEYFDKNLTKTLLDSGASIRALQWFIDLRCKDAVAPLPQQADELRKAGGGAQPFILGNYAMEYAWYGHIREAHKPQSRIGDKWDVAPIPQAVKDGKRYNVVGGQGFAVIQGAKNPDAAWAYAAYLLSDEGHKLMAGTWNPSRRSLALLGRPDSGHPKNFEAAFADAVVKYGFSPHWYVPGYNEWEDVINQELRPCWTCERNADTAAKTIAPLVNELMKQRPTTL